EAKAQLPGEELIEAETLDNIITELEPWLEEQTAVVIHAVYGYLKEDQELNVVISLEPIRAIAQENLRQTVLESLPPELQGASESQIEAFLSQVYGEIDNLIPQHFELNETSLGPEIMAGLEQARQIVGYIAIGYKVLIGIAVLLVLLVAMVHWWQPKPIARSVGIVFIVVGISFTLATLLSRFIPAAIGGLAGQSDILFELQPKLSQLVTDVIAPLQMYGIGFLIAGIALIVISFLLRSPEAYVPTRGAY
ncbi:MAG: hypothetical protein KAW81_04530, partial [Dehalococcoidia bacterium]|nr:hypothetical protein [Dehalococcoidia bacterium]